jgi:hypothetical protein
MKEGEPWALGSAACLAAGFSETGLAAGVLAATGAGAAAGVAAGFAPPFFLSAILIDWLIVKDLSQEQKAKKDKLIHWLSKETKQHKLKSELHFREGWWHGWIFFF